MATDRAFGGILINENMQVLNQGKKININGTKNIPHIVDKGKLLC
jgi:hypothetical protein